MKQSISKQTISNPILSIVIPTKNRQEFCVKSVEHIVSLGLDNVEVVIQDNSDVDLLRNQLTDAGILGKVKYNYNSAILSFTDNFSEAISLCTGKYICMIGDDDSVLPNIKQIAQYALDNNLDAVIPKLAVYFWPTANPINPRWRNGFLTSLPYRKNLYEKVDVENALIDLVKNSFQDYQKLNIPRIYHGIVKRECIEKVKNKCGTYFGGLTPDMFMSVSLCFTVNSVCTYSKPFTISGICPRSGSADSATGRHTGELKDAPHFKGHKSYNWIDYIPDIYTVDTIWAETGIQALRSMGGEKYETYFDKKVFIATLIHKFPQFTTRLYRIGEKYNISMNIVAKINRKISRNQKLDMFLLRLKKLLTFDFARKYYNTATIDEACSILCNLYNIKS